jgi:hypothetical protein
VSKEGRNYHVGIDVLKPIKILAAAAVLSLGFRVLCPTVILSNLPDSVGGAYVFRNGGVEAFARDLHLHAVLGDDPGGRCAFRWSDARSSFVQSGTE